MTKEETEDSNKFVEFIGWNCHDLGEPENDACRGWDGENRRCDCGNRRVALNDEGIPEAW